MISYLYQQVIRLRHWLYQKGCLKSFKIEGAKVVCVGNVIVGGAGKTPLIVKILGDLGSPKAALLSRGYKRPKNPKKGTWEEVGDEPALIKNRFPNISLYIGADRVKSAKQAVADGHTLILMDDGLQHLRIKKDITIAAVDGNDPFGGGRFLPFGRLRDLKEVLDTCDLRVVKGPPFPQMKDPSVSVKMVSKGGDWPKEVAIFCGIAKPEQFKRSVLDLGMRVVDELFVGDHDRVDEEILKRFSDESLRKGAKMLLSTEKDMVKYPSSLKLSLPLACLKVDLEIVEGQKQWDQLMKRILA